MFTERATIIAFAAGNEIARFLDDLLAHYNKRGPMRIAFGTDTGIVQQDTNLQIRTVRKYWYQVMHKRSSFRDYWVSIVRASILG